MENIKPNSDFQCLTSHFSPENCKWLAENSEGVDQIVKKLLKLIEEDEKSSSNKIDVFYQKKPELIACVEEFSIMHRSLAERYSNLIGDLRKSFPIFPQMQQPQVPDSALHQATVYLTPYQKPGPLKSEQQPIGFDLFLSSGGDTTDISLKDGSESSSSLSSYSDSESLNTPMNKHQAPSINGDGKKFELETELVGPEENEVLLKRVAEFEEELRVSSEKLRFSEEEVSRLKAELEKGESVILLIGDLQAELESAKRDIKMRDESLEMEKRKVVELQKRVAELESQIFDSGCEIGTLEEELKITKEKLVISEEESTKLKDEFVSKISQSKNHQVQLQSQLEAAQREMVLLETNIDFEKGQVLELQEKLLKYFADINSLHNAHEKTSLEKEKLQLDIVSLLEQKALLEARIEESDLKRKLLEHEIEQCNAEKLEMKSLHETQESRLRADVEQLKEELKQKCELVEYSKETLKTHNLKYDLLMKEKDSACAEVDVLNEIVGLKDTEIKEMEGNVGALKLERVELIGALETAKKLTVELRLRVNELEKEVDYRAEEKRAAIRELCFSLEHYRTGYQELREASIRQKWHSVLAW